MNNKIEEIKQGLLDILNQDKRGPQIERIKHTLLNMNYVKFKRGVMVRATNKLVGKIEVFKDTLHFIEMLCEELSQMEKELTEEGVEYYFPAEKELVETVDIGGMKATVIKEMFEAHHWQRANKQVIDERNHVPVSGKK